MIIFVGVIGPAPSRLENMGNEMRGDFLWQDGLPNGSLYSTSLVHHCPELTRESENPCPIGFSGISCCCSLTKRQLHSRNNGSHVRSQVGQTEGLTWE
jgi:hypothetical protein